MRTALALALIPSALLLQSGCLSSWELGETLPESCAKEFYFYQDADGDGWGEPGSTPSLSCENEAEAGYDARNDLDCDDADPDTTGRIWAVCPDALTWDAPTTYTGSIYAGDEYVIVHGEDTEVLSGLQSEISCEAWGGQLASFDSFTALDEALGDALSTLDSWAGFVDIGVVDGGWDWLDGSTAELGDIGWCTEAPEVPTDEEDEANARIALIWDGSGYCLGTPDEASALYTPWEGHFVCERAAPAASDYAEPGILAGSTGDTESADTGS